LDEANGIDFTDLGIENDEGELTGYGYVITDTFPLTQAAMYGDFDCDLLTEADFTTENSNVWEYTAYDPENYDGGVEDDV